MCIGWIRTLIYIHTLLCMYTIYTCVYDISDKSPWHPYSLSQNRGDSTSSLVAFWGINNWHEMTELEQQNTLRVLGKRNKQRRGEGKLRKSLGWELRRILRRADFRFWKIRTEWLSDERNSEKVQLHHSPPTSVRLAKLREAEASSNWIARIVMDNCYGLKNAGLPSFGQIHGKYIGNDANEWMSCCCFFDYNTMDFECSCSLYIIIYWIYIVINQCILYSLVLDQYRIYYLVSGLGGAHN